jgi:hypothetical protein
VNLYGDTPVAALRCQARMPATNHVVSADPALDS